MSNRAWMPLHIDDYIRDTDHLSATEHGAYLLLIMKYWRDGGLPSDEGLIRRYAKLSVEQWTESRAVLAALFDAEWRHKRIDGELAKAAEIIAKRKEAGRKTQFSNKTASAEQMPEHVPTKSTAPLTSNQDSYTADARAGSIDARMPELYAALGVTDETKSPGLLTFSEPIRWVNAGCDIDADILPALRSIAARGKVIKSWGYCSSAVFEARDRRIAPPPAVQQRSATAPPRRLTQGESIRNMAREMGIIDATGKPTGCLDTRDRDRENPGAGDVVRLAFAGNIGGGTG